MKLPAKTLICSAVLLSLFACSSPSSPEQSASAATSISETIKTTNPLLADYAGPYGGVPAFDKMQLNDLVPAFKFGFAEAQSDIEAISNNPAPPTFENTIVAMEKSGSALNRLNAYYGIWRSNVSSDEFREIQKELLPLFSEYQAKLNQNTQLFERIKAVYESENLKNYTPEEQRITWLIYNGFARNGATLSDEDKARYAEINKKLSQIQTQFANNVLADEENYVTYLTKDQLGGLPDSFIAGAAAAASERGKSGMYAITNTRSSMSPFLTYSTERALRKKVWETYYNRGNNGDQFDNNELVKEILKLRDERVKLLGYDNYASWRLEDRMAKNPENAMGLMKKVWPHAVAAVQSEVEQMQTLADESGDKITIEPWDYRFYAEKVRLAKYNLDSNEVKQYLQLDKLRDAMFYVAGRLFNFDFKAVPEGSVPVYHEDVKVWEVTDKTTGKLVGLWYLDPFARKGKRSGAWATTYRSYTTYNGEVTVLASNNSNFIKGEAGKPTLISWDDASTYFHEFGHALHFLSANVVYPTSHQGVRDYTEFQSQLLERWLSTDEVINQFLVHYETGEPIPQSLVKKIKDAANFNQGFSTTEYMASAIMDLIYHTTPPDQIEPQAFEKEQLEKLGMPNELVMRHRTTQFGHVFSSEGYATGYYGYMWADVLTSDAAEAFKEAPGGFYDEEVAERLVKYLFSVRNAIPPEEAYRLFRGRDANIDALMRDRGFITE